MNNQDKKEIHFPGDKFLFGGFTWIVEIFRNANDQLVAYGENHEGTLYLPAKHTSSITWMDRNDEKLLGYDEGVGTDLSCWLYGKKRDDGIIEITRIEYFDQTTPSESPVPQDKPETDEHFFGKDDEGNIHLCTEHPCKKQDKETVDMFKSGGKLEYVSDKPKRVEELEKEVERLKEFEWMYNDLCK